MAPDRASRGGFHSVGHSAPTIYAEGVAETQASAHVDLQASFQQRRDQFGLNALPETRGDYPAMSTYVRSSTVMVREHTLIDLGEIGGRVSADFAFPLPPEQVVNPYSAQTKPLLYEYLKYYNIYADRMEKCLRYQFEDLPACVHPYSSQIAQEASAYAYATLFGLDDGIDGKGVSDPIFLARLYEQMELAFNGNVPAAEHLPFPSDMSDSSRQEFIGIVQGLARLHEVYYHPVLEHTGAEFGFEKETLHEYLTSTLVEKRQEHQFVTEEQYLQNRQDTGGIRHAYAILAFFERINVRRLMKLYGQLGYMLREVADAVGILNDVLSAGKELKELQEKVRRSGGDPNNLKILKENVTSNLVLIKWRDGKSFQDAVNESIKQYEQKVRSFYSFKGQIKGDLEKDPQLVRAIFLMEGWLFGHPVWALKRSARYGDGATLDSQKIRQNLLRRPDPLFFKE
jgi:hypothetical protein